MKKVPPELLEYLHSRTEYFMCDLYEITLKSGLVFRYASYDQDVKLSDGRQFSHKGPLFKRDRIKLSAGITVDQLTVTVYVDMEDKIGNTPMMHIAHVGGFDEATLSLYRCFMSAPGVVVGAVDMFTGYVDLDGGGGLSMKWVVKSGVQKLNVDYPLRKYYPTCPYSLYDAGCGLSLASYTATGTVTGVSSYQDFNTDLNRSDGYYEQGGIEWLSGALAGVSAPIKASYQTNGQIVMLIPLDAAPAVGDTFRIYPGCDKTPATCKNKFNNFSRNRATPYIPLKETVL
ncbi:MAG TPA: hypothetical protein DD789_04025 [Firmicutes bacterium]|jgi:uncharacterized phage protein (TIGR02218 family)|nr:hypothetical protein [Bacillota bacterium]